MKYNTPIEIYEIERIADGIGGYTEDPVLQKTIFCSVNNKANSYKYQSEQNTDIQIYNITVRTNEYEFTLNTQIKFITGTYKDKVFKIVGIMPFDSYGYVDIKLQSFEPSRIGV